MTKICVSLFFLVLFCSNLFSESISDGIVNDDKVRIRDIPNTTGKIIGNINKGQSVNILGRSENRFYIDGLDSYWIKIKKDNQYGWIYGAFINISGVSYNSLAIVDTSKNINTIDLNYPRSIAQNELIKIEIDSLHKQTNRLFYSDIDILYQKIFLSIKNKQSLRNIFLNSVEVGITETSRYFILSTSELSDYIQQNFSENLTVSSLIKKDESYFFTISGFNQLPGFSAIDIKSIAFRIIKVIGSKYTYLNNRYIIDQVIITPYSVIDFNNNNEEYTNFILSSFSSDIPFFYQMLLFQ